MGRPSSGISAASCACMSSMSAWGATVHLVHLETGLRAGEEPVVAAWVSVVQRGSVVDDLVERCGNGEAIVGDSDRDVVCVDVELVDGHGGDPGDGLREEEEEGRGRAGGLIQFGAFDDMSEEAEALGLADDRGGFGDAVGASTGMMWPFLVASR